MARLTHYPFRLGTTSFIYPADYITNARQLMPRVDEIELLFFECNQLPSRQEIDELNILARDLGKTYNVHLPMDISMGDPSEAIRKKSVEGIARAMERVAPLSPTTHTLHLTYEDAQNDSRTVKAWQHRVTESTAALLQDTRCAPRDISVETLDFDPQWLAPVVSDLDLAVCVDIGHVIRYGYDLPSVLKSYADRITIIHLHGVYEGEDHYAINHLHPDIQRVVANFLQDFEGSCSLEVFKLNRFEQSLDAFPELMSHAVDMAN